METPHSLGYRLPAEWESQKGVWLSWPTNRATWPHCFERVQHKFAEIALILSVRQTVNINLADKHRSKANQALLHTAHELNLPRGEIIFFDHPVDDVWVRDHGPVYLKHWVSGSLALTNWAFNGWGEKHPFELDNHIPKLIAKQFEHPCFDSSLVLEGGSIEPNGVGDLLVTTDCLLNPNRNPGLSRGEMDTRLREGLGVEKVHWLDGCIEGDDTEGHIDNLVRFFKPDGVLVASTEDPRDPNFPILSKLPQQCSNLISSEGRSLEIIPLPIPSPAFHEGRRLPMSYLNFFICQGAVLVPTFGQPESDAVALEILGNAFPDRVIIPIDCQDLILEGGALHCLTQQVPQAGS